MQQANVLTKEWYLKLEEQAATSFVNLPIEFQLRGYDYDFIAKSYLNFFNCEDNTRQDKLILGKKFLKFVRGINKNRAKQELGEQFFICFQYFMENFSSLLSKQDTIHLETLDLITQAIDKSQFIEDIISVDELKRRVENLERVEKKEQLITSTWDEFQYEYEQLNAGREQKLLEEHNDSTGTDRRDSEESSTAGY